ncbi:YbaB/EbfC family nucleoid-associated protein [Rhodococcus spongiicola]|uniref:YbaB/EbfC family DNA-binding protein n=1 Tax=Rhodococcus spongiicola TaxID=2487352 RepID=A0A438ASC8_9NOCA|nr:YbaB/EbfC family nucleoid-associated protein [Rhodococcus spongiicola]RVW01599.1 YbaB/EbfC family DNA-binding protein [Rhodococcus spongiicola]
MVDNGLRDEALQRSRITAEAESPDGLVRVTVDAAGVVLSVWIDPTAFTRTTPDRLAASVGAAARAASTDVRARVADPMAPVAARGTDRVDLPDPDPGGPSVRNLVPTVATEFDPAAPRPAARPTPILRTRTTGRHRS